MKQPEFRELARMAAWALLVGSTACTGHISDPVGLFGAAGGNSGVGMATVPGAGPAAGSGAGGASGTGTGAGGSGPSGSPSAIGRVVLRRMTRAEYDNTARDLLGVDIRPADAFPPDVGAYGFDNAAGSQSLSASHLEAFEQASEKLVTAWAATPALRSRVLTCDIAQATCMRTALEGFTPKAWRRPVQPTEIDRLITLAQTEKGTPDAKLQLALRGVLTSPNFIFLTEKDPDPTSLAIHRLAGHELANRMSYFLWSSMPDDKLFAAAPTLQDDATLVSEFARMLADPKARALLDEFAAQWFDLPGLDDHEVEAKLFPTVTPALLANMQDETKLFFQDVLAGGGAIRSLLVSDHTFVNPALAAHYKLPAPAGTGFSKISVANTNRLGGILGHASVLTDTSAADATRPVKRGEWVLTNVLCTPPPPPPPGVNTTLPPPNADAGLATTRDRLAAHRSDPICAGCHNSLDPVGLGLENYDAVGAYRTMDNGKAVDPSGKLPNGLVFKNGQELAQSLADDPQMAACVLEKLFTYALGRPPTTEDAWHVGKIGAKNPDAVRDVLQKLVTSETFRSRRGEM